jgi:excisionase family DNA binding protein
MFLTLTEAARRIGVPKLILVAWIENGRIAAYVDPRTHRRVVKAFDVAEFLRSNPPAAARVIVRADQRHGA